MLVSATLFSAFGFLISAETRSRQALFVTGLFFTIVGMWATTGGSVSTLAGCLAQFFIFVQVGLFFGVLRTEDAVGYVVQRAFRLV